MSWANVNWDEVKAKYEEGTYTYQRLAEEYGVSIQTVCSHAAKGQWQRGREEAEAQRLLRCLRATARRVETGAKGARERGGEGGQGAGRAFAGAGGDGGEAVPA